MMIMMMMINKQTYSHVRFRERRERRSFLSNVFPLNFTLLHTAVNHSFRFVRSYTYLLHIYVICADDDIAVGMCVVCVGADERVVKGGEGVAETRPIRLFILGCSVALRLR